MKELALDFINTLYVAVPVIFTFWAMAAMNKTKKDAAIQVAAQKLLKLIILLAALGKFSDLVIVGNSIMTSIGLTIYLVLYALTLIAEARSTKEYHDYKLVMTDQKKIEMMREARRIFNLLGRQNQIIITFAGSEEYKVYFEYCLIALGLEVSKTKTSQELEDFIITR